MVPIKILWIAEIKPLLKGITTKYTRTHRTIFPFLFDADGEPRQTPKKKEIGGLIPPLRGFRVRVYVITTSMT